MEEGQWLTISNEFTTVRVRTVRTRNGERLEVESPKLGRSIQLDPLELESLTWWDARTFSELLKTPYGPEEDTEELRPMSDLLGDTPRGSAE
jgi:hypothetical protein